MRFGTNGVHPRPAPGGFDFCFAKSVVFIFGLVQHCPVLACGTSLALYRN